MTATVDVIIPAFNAERFVRAAAMSALAQTYPVQRVIVVDDASTDRTTSVLASIADPRLQIVSLHANRGEAGARNAGLRIANAAFVAFLDADDTWSHTKIERQIELFKTTTVPDCGVVYCGLSYIDEQGHPAVGTLVPPRYRGNLFPHLLKRNCISGSASAVMIKKACIAEIGEFDEQLSYGTDWDYWLRCSAKFGFDFVPEPLVQIRLHSSSIQGSLTRFKRYRRIRQRLSIVRKWSEDKPLPPRYYRDFLFEALILSARRRRWWLEFRALRNRLAKIDPGIEQFSVVSWAYIGCKLLYTRYRQIFRLFALRQKPICETAASARPAVSERNRP